MPSTVVLIHGIGQDRNAWQFLNPARIDAAHVESYEIPGHGTTPRSPGMSWSSLADDLVSQYPGVLDLVSIGAPGEIVIQALVNHAPRIRSALIVAGGRLGSTQLGEGVKAERERRAQAAMVGGMASFVDEAIARWFGSDDADTPPVKYAREALLAMAPEAWADAQFADLNTQLASVQDLAAVNRPVTLIGVRMPQAVRAISGGAAATSQHSLESAQRLQALLKRSRVVEVEGSGMLHLSDPDRFLKALNDHLRWVAESAAA